MSSELGSCLILSEKLRFYNVSIYKKIIIVGTSENECTRENFAKIPQ